jgi:hypothetical protein
MMMRVTVYLTERTYEKLVTLAATTNPQLLKRTAAQLLSFAIKAFFRSELLTITGRLVRPAVLLEDASPTEETTSDEFRRT